VSIITKQLSVDFIGGINTAILHSELAIALPGKLKQLTQSGDDLLFEFSGTLNTSEIYTLDAAIAAHNPAAMTHQAEIDAQKEAFGKAYTYSSQESVQVVMDDDWVEVLSLTPLPLASDGVYRIAWFYEWSADTTSDDFNLRVHLDDTTEINRHTQKPKDSGGDSIGGSGTDQRHVASGFYHAQFTAGETPSIDIDIRCDEDDYEVTVYRARLEFWRVN